MFQTKNCRLSQNTHSVFSNVFPKIFVIYEKMWKNAVEPDRPQMAIWRMCIACWRTEGKNTAP